MDWENGTSLVSAILSLVIGLVTLTVMVVVGNSVANSIAAMDNSAWNLTAPTTPTNDPGFSSFAVIPILIVGVVIITIMFTAFRTPPETPAVTTPSPALPPQEDWNAPQTSAPIFYNPAIHHNPSITKIDEPKEEISVDTSHKVRKYELE